VLNDSQASRLAGVGSLTTGIDTKRIDIMKKFLGIIAICLAVSPLVYAEESTVADKAIEVKDGVKDGARDAAHEVGKAAVKTGHAIKKAARKARQAVIVRCADGRHALKRKGDCDGHGGVDDPA
jgi:hypothetical protein